MKRFTTNAQADFCDGCAAVVITTNRDVLGDVASDIVADPIALTQQQQIACIIGRRPLYRIEQPFRGSANLGIKHPGTDGRRMAGPDDVLVAHRCGRVFEGPATKVLPDLLDIRHALYDIPIPF